MRRLKLERELLKLRAETKKARQKLEKHKKYSGESSPEAPAATFQFSLKRFKELFTYTTGFKAYNF